MSDHPLLSHRCLSDLVIGKEAYEIEIFGDNRGNYVGTVREEISSCTIALVGRLVTRGDQRVLVMRGFLTVPAKEMQAHE
ncbi:MAG: hypothetical protein ABF665_09205 [Gluconacetobacter sp.]